MIARVEVRQVWEPGREGVGVRRRLFTGNLSAFFES